MKGKGMVKKMTMRSTRAVGAFAVLVAMTLGSVPALATDDEAPESSPDVELSETVPPGVEEGAEEDEAEEVSGESEEVADESGAEGLSLFRPYAVATAVLDAVSEARAESGPAGEVYDNPDHRDVETFVDEETGETFTLGSGVTHWTEAGEEGAASSASTYSTRAADYASIFTVTGPKMVSGAEIADSDQSTLRIDIDIPASASAGDQYTLTMKKPLYWRGTTISDREIKDASGKVFAVTEAIDEWPNNGGAFTNMRITLTQAVDEHAEVKGFIEVRFYAAFGKVAKTVTVDAFSPTGQALGPGIAGKTLIADPANSFSHSDGSVFENQSAVTTAVNVLAADLKAGFTFTVKPISSGLTSRGCDYANVMYQGFDSGGLWGTKSVSVPDMQCTLNPDGSMKVVLPTVPKNTTGLSDGEWRVGVRYMADQPGTKYEVLMTTNATPAVLKSWQGNITSGVPLGEGADHLHLKTTKTAAFTTLSGSDKPTVGDTITYTLTTSPGATNDRAIRDLVTTDKLPAGLQFVSANNGGEYNATSREIVWGPRILTSTGEFKDIVTAKIVSIPESKQIVNTVKNIGEEVCTEGDLQSTCDATVTTPVGVPGFDFTKSSKLEDTNKNGFLGDEGDTVLYTFTVKNTGEYTITTAKLTDDLLNIKDKECLTAPLAAGASTTCAGGPYKHVITKADVDAGEVVNHATLCVDPIFGLDCKPGTTIERTEDPGFSFKKYSEVKLQDEERGFEGAIAGDTIHYWYTVTNTGDVELEDVTVDDDLVGLKGAPCVETLPVGAKDVKCETTATYVITKADQEAGEVLNQAVGKVPGLPDQPDEVIDPTVDPSFEFDKSVLEIRDPAGKLVTGGKAGLGDVIHFGFKVTNTGDVALKTVLVSDPMLGVSKVECLPANAVLEPEETVDCVDHASYKYTVTQADVTAGKVHNVATGSVPGLPDEPGETTTPVLPNPVPTELPKTGAGGTWLLAGAGTLLLLGGSYALIRARNARVKSDIPA